MVSTTSLLVSSILKPHQVPQENHFRSLHTTTKDLSQNKVVPISYPALSALKPPRLPLPVPPIPPLKTARKNSLANIEADSSTSSESSMPFSSHEALVIHPPSSDHGYILASKLPHQPQLEATETEVKKEVPEDDPISPNLKLVEEAAEAVRNKLHSEVVSTTSLLVSSILKPHQVPQENHFRSLHTTTKDLSQNTVVPNSFPALSALKPPRLPPIPPLQIAGKDSVASIEAASSTSSESSILSVRPLPSQGTGIGEREAPRENKEPEGFDPFHGDIKPLTPQNPPPRLGKRRSKDTNGEITEVHRYMTRRNTIESTAPIVPGTKKARRESKKSSHGANTSLGASSSTTLPISSTTTPAPKAVVEPDATPVGSIRIAYFVDPALAPLTLPDSEGGAILKKSDGLYPTFMCNAVLFILKDPALLVDRILPEIPMAMILVDGTPGKDAKAKVKMIPEQKRPNALLRDIFWAIMRQI